MENQTSSKSVGIDLHHEEYPSHSRRQGKEPKRPLFEELIPRPLGMGGRRKKLLYYDCNNCGIVFSVRAKDRKTHPHTFCSSKCHAQWHSRNLIGTKRSMRTKKRISYGKRKRAHPMENDVEWYERAKKDIEMYRNTPEWRKKSRKIQRRDGCVCQACGLGKPDVYRLTVHHIYPLSIWIEKGQNPFDYPDFLLVTLCDRCHTKTEAQDGLYRWPSSARMQ